MNRLLAILLFSSFLQSCDDGDIILTNFNFENAPLKTCGDIGNYVFYKENPQVFESLSLRLGTTDSIYKTEGLKTYELTGTSNYVNYRSYDGALGNSYFCNSIPPISPKVESDYLASSGTVEIYVTFNYEDRGVNKSALTLGNQFTDISKENTLSSLNNLSSPSNVFENRSTLKKDVQIILKNLVLINGDTQIIQETLDMGTIENVQIVEIP